MKISRISVVDQVCDSIKQDIADGVWNAGDKLPSEAEFANMFGVNRLSVRMALQKLSTLGIIDTRVGEGSFVRAFSLKPVLTELSVFYQSDDVYNDTLQLRNLLEFECLRLAVQSVDEQELADLRQALDAYNQAVVAYYNDLENPALLEQLVDADFHFHYTVVRFSHNRLFKDVYYMVQHLIRRYISERQRQTLHRRKEAGLPPLGENDTHVKIYDCIRNADLDALRRAHEEMLGIRKMPGIDVFD